MKTTKVQVTALKAPWPEGTKVGSIVAFKGEPPAWAAGKFTDAPQDAKADVTYEPAEVIEGHPGVALPSIDAVNAEVADLQAKLAAAEEANVKLSFEKAAAEAALADLQAKHDAEMTKAKELAVTSYQNLADDLAATKSELQKAQADLAAATPKGAKK